MLREALYAKIHYAVVTECHPDYMGSITIDPLLLEATGIQLNEKVLVADCDNGNRFETYVFEGERGSGIIGVNGAAANLTGIGHRILVLSFCQLTAEELDLDGVHRFAVVASEPLLAYFGYDCCAVGGSTFLPTEDGTVAAQLGGYVREKGIRKRKRFRTDDQGEVYTDDVPDAIGNSWGISPIYHGSYITGPCDVTFWTAIDNCEAAGVVLLSAETGYVPQNTIAVESKDDAAKILNQGATGSVSEATKPTIMKPRFAVAATS